MNHKFNFYEINQYDSYVISINKKDYKKMQKCIAELKKKYNSQIEKLYQIEKNNTIKFDFNNQINFMTKHKRVLIDIINDVLNIYSEELSNLSVVFLSGSFARCTNKMSSDVDLHFFL